MVRTAYNGITIVKCNHVLAMTNSIRDIVKKMLTDALCPGLGFSSPEKTKDMNTSY
jgi:hypothetical protein